MTWQLRPFNETDAPVVHDLFHRQARRYHADFAEPGTFDWLAEAYPVSRVAGWTADLVTVAEDAAGRVVAFVRGKHDGWIVQLYVEDQWMGKGLGSRLLERVEQQIADCPVDAIQLNAFPDNYGFYAARGYQQIDQRHEHGMQFIVMRKAL
jgi:GNAT superfamily N-acetyltransferase